MGTVRSSGVLADVAVRKIGLSVAVIGVERIEYRRDACPETAEVVKRPGG